MKELREAEQKGKENAKRLHKIIIEGGLGESGPTDEEVEKTFSQLQHTIFQFVMKHCTNHASTRGVYGLLSAEAKNWYVVAQISNQIFDHLFAGNVMLFGFGLEMDNKLGSFEEAWWKHKSKMSS